MTFSTQTLTAASPERYSLPAFQLRLLDAAIEQGPKRFDQRVIYVGSAPDNDLVIDDVSVSRNHLKIEGEQGGYRIVDLGSKNGLWLAGARVREAILNQDTILRLGQSQLSFELLDTQHEVALARQPKFGRMLGQSAQMREIFALLAKVAATDVTALVQGESGTGKELVAEALHEHSGRRPGPFVIFDCSAVQRNLVESELFGHVRGAYTGAIAARDGAFVEADGGTLFLDEIGELDLDLQPKLLRALDNREVRPVGGGQRRKVDVRLVAATNRDLSAMVQEGTFRQDLFYRLNVVKIQLPPLRRRPEDIPQLVESFLADIQRRGAGRSLSVSFRTMNKLQSHPWPGNVRELRNHVERAVVLSDGEELEVQLDNSAPRLATHQIDDALAARFDLPFKDAKARLIETFERSYWHRALQRTGWNISAAARETGLHRKSLEYLIRKLDLKRPSADE
ncbi:MAG TPA: sigma-54-dependent Fis family transcriptional regulator [Myxococcales bacterium]|nr:sigma-54-dependent Fis family transcriptional regulator [Myxococcales bacterium]HAN32685.1 sigma-54-dependent Fis family transcriptional regulator [Myxococcales bacterium]